MNQQTEQRHCGCRVVENGHGTDHYVCEAHQADAAKQLAGLAWFQPTTPFVGLPRGACNQTPNR